MNIVHIIIGLNAGGAELMLQRLILSDLTSYHSVISMTTPGVVGEYLKDHNINVVSLGLNKYNLIIVFCKLFVLLRKTKPDVVQTWMYHADLLGGISARLSGIKKVFWNIRCTEVPQRKFSFHGMLILLCALLSSRIPEKIICCAHAAKAHHAALGYCSEKIIVIPNGYHVESKIINHRNTKDLRNHLGIKNNTFVVGVIGRYDILKGYDILVNAAHHLLLNSSRDILFLCIGKNMNWDNIELATHINSLKLQRHFALIGEVKSVDIYFSLMDVFCLSSRSEGFPNVVAEAMIARVPCVVTDVGDAAMIVGREGVVVPPCNHLALSNGLSYFVEMDPVLKNAIGDKARNRVISNYNIGRIAQIYKNLYAG